MDKIITLTTDFGLKDSYVGAMKGAILSLNPYAMIVDITHLVSPGNIIEGALVLNEAYGFFPKGTIHVGVVDPGVGGRRMPVLIETDRYTFIGPDNGLFSLAIQKEKVRRVINLSRKKYFLKKVSSTFHGRDIFGPAAAHLSLGVDPGKLGDTIKRNVLKNVPFIRPKKKGGLITGEVVRIDSFGSLLTNIRKEDIAGHSRIEAEINGVRVKGLQKTYSDVGAGRPLALIGSSGNLEIAVNNGIASDVLDASIGDKVVLRFSGTR
jgi:S-adenosyl-L-methionine hydrolase (adenosine-forming)